MCDDLTVIDSCITSCVEHSRCAAAGKKWRLTPVVLRAMSILLQRTTHLMIYIYFGDSVDNVQETEIVSVDVSQPGMAPCRHELAVKRV